MQVYRICKTKYARDLTGTGARLAGGRWNRKGLAVLYTSESRALAALEFLVHLEFMANPEQYSLLTIELPAGLEITPQLLKDLPANWREHPSPSSTIELGSQWLLKAETPVLQVPSTLIPHERNYLINPLHPDAVRVTLLSLEDFIYDERLLKGII